LLQQSSSGGSTIEDVKAALQKGPLITTLAVYADFESYSSGVYKHVDDGNAPEGGHAVSIIGYDDSKNAWLIRNSWSKPMSGTAYLEAVLSSGSSVPLDQVTRHIYDSTGKEIESEYRLYTILAPKMEFGWTTSGVPNGTYKVVYSAQLSYKGTPYTATPVTYNVTVAN
jgi:hypothetical protein